MRARKQKPPGTPVPVTRSASYRASQWSAGDRIGKVTAPVLREAEVRATLGLPIDPELLADVFTLASEILAATVEASGESVLTLNEVADQVRALEEQRKEQVDSAEESAREARKELDDERERIVSLVSEHNDQIRHWKQQAQKAESDLRDTVKRGHELDAEARAARETLRTLRSVLRTVLATGDE